jgi:transposase
MKQHHFTEVEMKRYYLLQEVQNGHLTLAQAASLMGVSYRHAIRLKQRFLQQGVQGLKRRQPAQPPHQKITPQLQQTILQLRQSIYYDFNLRHFQEKLALHHHIYLGYETLRQLLIQAGLHQPRHKRKVYRRRRRMPCAGMLVQMGSSQHSCSATRGRPAAGVLRSGGTHGGQGQHPAFSGTGVSVTARIGL